MSAWAAVKTVWARLGDASTLAWLWGFVLASGVTSTAVSVMPGGWHPPQYWALSAFWFFGVLAASVTITKGSVWAWKRVHPPALVIATHGGEDASLVVEPSVSGDYYGTGWILNDGAKRKRPFTLNWGHYASQYRRIRGKDKTAAVLAGIDGDRYNPSLVVYGDLGVVERWSLRGHNFSDEFPWIRLRVEFRAKQFPNVWLREFRVRLDESGAFEIEDVTP